MATESTGVDLPAIVTLLGAAVIAARTFITSLCFVNKNPVSIRTIARNATYLF